MYITVFGIVKQVYISAFSVLYFQRDEKNYAQYCTQGVPQPIP